MSEVDVLRMAADIMQRKVEIIVKGSIGIPLTGYVAEQLMTAGLITQQVEILREFAERLSDE